MVYFCGHAVIGGAEKHPFLLAEEKVGKMKNLIKRPSAKKRSGNQANMKVLAALNSKNGKN